MGSLTKNDILYLVNKFDGYSLKNAVETGLCEGQQLHVISETFENVWGIELDRHYCEISMQKVPTAHILHGDTRKILPRLCKSITGSCTFFLDAHYCKLNPPIKRSIFPLWDELKCIADRKCNDIVIVDDVHTFGVMREDLKYSPQSKEWESVNEQEILKFFPKAKSTLFHLDSFVIWL